VAKYEDDIEKLKFGGVGIDDGTYYLFEKDMKKMYAHFTLLVHNRHDFLSKLKKSMTEQPSSNRSPSRSKSRDPERLVRLSNSKTEY